MAARGGKIYAMSTASAVSRLVLVHDSRPPVRHDGESVRRYQLARVRVAELRGPDAVHAHLARLYD